MASLVDCVESYRLLSCALRSNVVRLLRVSFFSVSMYMIVFLSGLKNYGEFCELRMTTSQPSSRDDTHTRCLHANLLWVCEFQQCLKTDPVYDWEKKHSLKGIGDLRMTTRVEIGKPELHCSIGHHTRNLHSDRPPNSCGPDVHDCKKQSLSIFPVVLSTG